MDNYAARLERLDTAGVADALAGIGVLDPAMQTIVPCCKIASPAFTVMCYPGSSSTVRRALMEATPGDILVVDGEGDKRARSWAN